MRSLVKEFLALESASSIILLLMAVFALMLANSPLASEYQQASKAFLPFINEGLMAIFFLVVGLELKRGFVEGPLSRRSHVALPAVAALGGMLIPALVYLGINHDNAITVKGWAIPTATDIAFAVGVLSLFGKRVPQALKLFLLALAIFDDIGAIIIIAVFYSKQLSYFMLFQAFILFIVLCLLGRYLLNALLPYLLIGILLWLCLHHSGIHPTIAGVLLALTIPASPSKRLETILHPWVAYIIMPLFALANAGVSLSGINLLVVTDVVVIGIVLGLFVGKQIGVFGFAWLMIRSKIATLPEGSSWATLYGVALLCGIGFTMSLFLGTLSFPSGHYLTEVRLGVIFGSLLSGLVGAFVLLIALTQRRNSIAK
jgi:NhaA family Na+:H+ antiporter